MFETTRGPLHLIKGMKCESRWFDYSDINIQLSIKFSNIKIFSNEIMLLN
jgi:hypothetical protein